MAPTSSPSARTLQVLSQRGHDQSGSTAKKELNVIQTKNMSTATKVVSKGGNLRSFEKNHARRVTMPTTRLRRSTSVIPYASRFGLMQVSHAHVSTPANGYRNVSPRQARSGKSNTRLRIMVAHRGS